MKAYAAQYRTELLDEVIPFWLKHSQDERNGGYFTCLRPDGTVYDTDKFVWLQGRQVWTFATLYQQVEQRGDWLEMALHGADFLERHGRADNGDWYFSLTATGEPLVQPYNIFSDCFAAQAFGKLHAVTGRARYADVAKTTFERILKRRDNPKREWEKGIAGTRPLRNFALPMILCNLARELADLLDPALVRELTDECLQLVMDTFYDPGTGLIMENVAPGGGKVDSFEGRLLNPGHAIEAMWFVMDLAHDRGDQSMIEVAKNITLRTLDYAWDEKYGGLFYFMDRAGAPPQQLEWDQKLWWVHLETLIALGKGYHFTGDERCAAAFERVHDWAWLKFRDAEHGGEWFGYLNRRGEVLLDLKGGKWKGCYHVPRALLEISNL